jgi:hypothetical protein
MLPLPACTRLRRACLDNDVAVVEEVLDGAAATGAGVGATASVLVLPWDRRATACHWAALSDSVAVLDCLRSRFGVDAFALHNGVGESAMHWACRAGAAAAGVHHNTAVVHRVVERRPRQHQLVDLRQRRAHSTRVVAPPPHNRDAPVERTSVKVRQTGDPERMPRANPAFDFP